MLDWGRAFLILPSKFDMDFQWPQIKLWFKISQAWSCPEWSDDDPPKAANPSFLGFETTLSIPRYSDQLWFVIYMDEKRKLGIEKVGIGFR